MLGFALILLAAAALLALNGFFVLAEFAIVKIRETRIEELVRGGHPRARLLLAIRRHLDEYLSVCQVGITLASVALGMVGELGAQRLGAGEGSLADYALAIAFSYVLVSGSHIVVGELVPKSIAIRVADRAALGVALPLRFFHRLFFIPLWILNRTAALCLRLIGFAGQAAEGEPSKAELRILLDHSQSHGLLSFHQLLFIENVFDFGELRVRDAMRPRASVRTLRAGDGWDEARHRIREWRFSRYPLIAGDPDRPVGILHLKDLLLAPEGRAAPDLAALARPFLRVEEDEALERTLARMRRRRVRVALAFDAAGRWTGMLALEDVIEEIVGTISDEFEADEGPGLADAIAPARMALGISADSLAEAIRLVLFGLPPGELPQPAAQVVEAVLARERLAGTYLGHGIAMPHARLPGLDRPLVVFASSREGIPVAGGERAHLLFLLLTPAGAPRVHQRLQATIAGMLAGSGYIADRLREAASPAQAVEILSVGAQVAQSAVDTGTFPRRR